MYLSQSQTNSPCAAAYIDKRTIGAEFAQIWYWCVK